MFLLIQEYDVLAHTQKLNLHSNMFLLIPWIEKEENLSHEGNLHSNMFLLILSWLFSFLMFFCIYIPICFY